MPPSTISRRGFLKAGGAAAVPLVAGCSMLSEMPDPRDRVLRIAHLTDVHVQPEGPAPGGMARALHAAQRLAEPADIIFNGGDSIMDALNQTKDRTRAQWKVWQDTLRAENALPVVHAIGNHDVWGWSANDASLRQDALYGKQWAMDEFELSSPFYSFDRAGWHFVVLDSSFPKPGGGYTARLNEEQFAWLRQDLGRTPSHTPVCVLSHIPILCLSAFFDGDNEKTGDWHVPGAWMHIDARRIKDLFRAHPNVKLALSGHIHLHDRVDYLGVTYLCNGAVSGGWWGGNYQEFPPAFAVVDLYGDGSFSYELQPYAWQ